jgi:A/G-specific adenine glycosylase
MKIRRTISCGRRRIKLADVSYFQERILAWWRSSKRWFPWRHPDATLYIRIVSEVLLQRTRAEAVAAFWPAFIKRFPGWKQLAEADPDELSVFLKPLGLARQRAPRLHALAVAVWRAAETFPTERSVVQELPGVGQYIGNAILLFVHGEPTPLLDANAARVLERFFGPRKLVDLRYDPYLQSLAHQVVQHEHPETINWAILDLAATVCKSHLPRCEACPLHARCKFAFARHRAADRTRETGPRRG